MKPNTTHSEELVHIFQNTPAEHPIYTILAEELAKRAEAYYKPLLQRKQIEAAIEEVKIIDDLWTLAIANGTPNDINQALIRERLTTLQKQYKELV